MEYKMVEPGDFVYVCFRSNEDDRFIEYENKLLGEVNNVLVKALKSFKPFTVAINSYFDDADFPTHQDVVMLSEFQVRITLTKEMVEYLYEL